MKNTSIAIVCDGREISYGMNLLHLTKYRDEETAFFSEKCSGIDTEIYSAEVYRRTQITSKTISVFIGEMQSVNASMNKIFDKYGMTIWMDDANAIIRAETDSLNGERYSEFIKFANRKRNEYIETEKDYVRKTAEKNNKWIASEFKEITSNGLFGHRKNIRNKMQQQYDCMAFVFYLEFLCKEKM